MSQDNNFTEIETEIWLNYCYLASAFLFVKSLRYFHQQETAKIGNWYAIIGLILAITSTYASEVVYGNAYWIFVVAALPPGICAFIFARLVPMTSMPQMIGFLNACGGLSAVLTVLAVYFSPYEAARQRKEGPGSQFQVYQTVFYLISATLGFATVTGSFIACAKLAGLIRATARHIPYRYIIDPFFLLSIAGLAVVPGYYGLNQNNIGTLCLFLSIGLAGIYGMIVVAAIGGADMPVVISVLNSASGWTLVFTGFTIKNSLIIIAGSFVGASGFILSLIMCRAMNRNLGRVLMGGFGLTNQSEPGHNIKGEAKSISPADAASLLFQARSVIIVPGYGMAVSRAQHALASLTNDLLNLNIDVRYAIHPVAGRLPGHMNVLLAEADVPYDIVFSMDEINNDFPNTEIVLVIGANDTVNPASQDQPKSAIYGMPVLEVWKAKQIITLKRSLNVGYAGVDNSLFFYPNNSMLLGDAKDSVERLVDEIYELRVNNLMPMISKQSTKLSFACEQILEDKTKLFPLSNPLCCLGVIDERTKEERRVMLTPYSAKEYHKKMNIQILIESGAGSGAGYDDDSYINSGCLIKKMRSDIYESCQIIVCINPPPIYEIEKIKSIESKILIIGFLDPNQNGDYLKALAPLGITIIAMDIMPRITTAQKMDILSSTAKVVGFRAVIEGVSHYDRLMGPDITAAGKYPPAKVLVIGAGVAGLQAIGDAKRLGADVRGFDVRLECQEQVESMGGKFLKMNFEESGSGEGGYARPMSPEFIAEEMRLFAEQASICDIIITTAAIPGKIAPKLLLKYHVDLMKPGSVIVDVAAPSGGNCELTIPNQTYIYRKKKESQRNNENKIINFKEETNEKINQNESINKYMSGVTIIGDCYLASKSSGQVSDMYSYNLMELVKHLNLNRENFVIDLEDNIMSVITIITNKTIRWPPPPKSVSIIQPLVIEDTVISNLSIISQQSKLPPKEIRIFGFKMYDLFMLVLTGALVALLALTAPEYFAAHFMELILSSWVGYLLVLGVTSALHTPLMSVTNAMSGVVILAGMTGISYMATKNMDAQCMSLEPPEEICIETGTAAIILNSFSIAVASINGFGGFVVTDRMLRMFKKR